MVKRIVTTHSKARSHGPYRAAIEEVLSSMTATTLRMINTISATSKALPAGVSASKMISWIVFRSFDGLLVMAFSLFSAWKSLAGVFVRR